MLFPCLFNVMLLFFWCQQLWVINISHKLLLIIKMSGDSIFSLPMFWKSVPSLAMQRQKVDKKMGCFLLLTTLPVQHRRVLLLLPVRQKVSILQTAQRQHICKFELYIRLMSVTLIKYGFHKCHTIILLRIQFGQRKKYIFNLSTGMDMDKFQTTTYNVSKYLFTCVFQIGLSFFVQWMKDLTSKKIQRGDCITVLRLPLVGMELQ